MKRAILFVITVLLVVAAPFAAAQGSRMDESVPYEAPASLPDGEGNPIASLTMTGFEAPSPQRLDVQCVLTNETDVAITRVTLRVAPLDENGDSILEEPMEFFRGFFLEPVEPGETREFQMNRIFDGAGDTRAIRIVSSLAQTETDLPRWTDPLPDNNLLQFCDYAPFTACFDEADERLPVRLYYHRDEMYDGVTEDPDTIRKVLEELRKVRIGDETQICVTDSSFSYLFELEDGRQWSVGFESGNVFPWHGKNYEVLSLAGLRDIVFPEVEENGR